MNVRMRTLVLCIAVLPLFGSTAAAQSPMGAGMPTQAQTDQSAAQSSAGAAGWGDLPGGVAARPYVRSLTVINGSTATPVITDGTTANPAVPIGGITAVIAPLNLCRPGQTPAQGQCYATPNRVSLTLTYSEGETNGYDFGAPAVPVTPTVDANTVFDITIALNTLGRDLRWTSMNGDLLYWDTANLGRDDATVHVKLKPAMLPTVAFTGANGCTATPIRDCDIPRATGETLSANMVFSLDGTLDDALTGAAFATQNAIMGFLSPGGTPQSPSLDIQMASSHLRADGSPQLGTLKAFLPAAALLNLYGLTPQDTGAFSTTRGGDAGSNDAPTYTPWSAADQGSDGVLVTVRDITFSVPNYRVASRLPRLRTSAKLRRGRTTVAGRVPACARRACVATLYDLGPQSRGRFRSTRRTIVPRRRLRRARLSMTTTSAALGKGHRYLVVVRRPGKAHRLVTSALGVVA